MFKFQIHNAKKWSKESKDTYGIISTIADTEYINPMPMNNLHTDIYINHCL